MRLLIVEDNNDLSRFLTNGLAAAGYAADVAETAASASAALAATRFAAVILESRAAGQGRDVGPARAAPAPGSDAGAHPYRAVRHETSRCGVGQRRRRLPGEALGLRGIGGAP